MLRLSRVILIVGVILALLGTALIVVPGYVDWTRYRSIVETAVGDAIGRRVSIDGEIALTVLPKPAFEIGEVTVFPTTEIAPPGAGAPLGEGAPPAGEGAPLKVGLMTATIEPRPLFQGDFHITSLVLAQTELNLGARNPVDFLNTKSDGPVTFDPGVLLTGWASRVGGFFSNVRIDELGLEDASITWLREEANGGQETLRVERASARLLSATGPFEARGSILFRDRAYDADLNVASFANRAEIPFDFEILARDTKLLAALRGTAAGMESETPVLTGTVEFAGPSVSLLLPAFGDGAAIGPQDAEPVGQTRDEAGKSVPFRIIGPVRYRDGQIKAEALTWSQGPDSLTVGLDADLKDRSILRLDVTADDPLRLGPAALPAFERFVARPGPLLRAFKKADLDFVLPSASIGPWQSDRFHGALYFEEGRVSLMDFDAEGGAFGRARLRGQPKQGTDSLVTTATFNADFADPRQAMSELGADLDRVAEGLYESLSVAASLTISPDLIRIETFRINLDENSYQGAMALRRSQRTSLGLSLSGQRFDFDGYGLAGPVRSLLQGGTGDVSLKVAAGAVRLQGITLAGLGLNARRVNGLVTLEAFEAETDLFGALTAAGTVSLADPSAPLDLKGSWAGSPCSVQRLSETSSPPEGGGESEGGPTVFCRLLETATTQFALTGTGEAAMAALTLGAPEQDPATLTVGAFDIFDVQGGRSVPVSGSGRTDALTWTFDGTAAGITRLGRAEGTIEVTGADFALAADRFLDLGADGLPATPFTAMARVGSDGARMRIDDLLLRLPERAVTARFEAGRSVDIKGPLSAVVAGLGLPSALPGLTDMRSTAPLRAPWPLLAIPEAMPFSLTGQALRDVDGPGGVEGGFVDYSASGTIGGGRLVVDRLSVPGWGGLVTGQAGVERRAEGYYLTADLAGSSLDLGRLGPLQTGELGLKGLGDVKMSLQTKGTTANRMAQNATGLMEVEMPSGALQGADLDAFGERVRLAPRGQDVVSARENDLRGGETPLTDLSALMTINAGKGETARIQARLGEARLTGRVAADFTSGALDGTLRVIPDEGTLPAPLAYRMEGAVEDPTGEWDVSLIAEEKEAAWERARALSDIISVQDLPPAVDADPGPAPPSP